MDDTRSITPLFAYQQATLTQIYNYLTGESVGQGDPEWPIVSRVMRKAENKARTSGVRAATEVEYVFGVEVRCTWSR